MRLRKIFCKLMNNSIFGKTIENVEKRTNVELLTHWENIGQQKGANTKNNFHSNSVFTDNLVAIQMNRLKIKYDKPIYISVLELSKTLMYDFHYDFIIPKYRKTKLMYTDTDSFIYEIIKNHFYIDIKNDIDQHLDTSDYQTDNKYGIEQKNKKVLGKFKDVLAGELLVEFMGL